MAVRISHKAEELARQCRLSSNAIGGEPNWPVTAPTEAKLLTDSNELNTRSTRINDLESQLRKEQKDIKPFIEEAREDMTQIDRTTDMLYGPDDPKKLEYGLDPKKTEHEHRGEPERVVIKSTSDGSQHGSIEIDWETVEGSNYVVQWFNDAALTQLVGTTTVTSSKVEIENLESGKQYWFQVRAIRGGQEGKWSDPATSIASL